MNPSTLPGAVGVPGAVVSSLECQLPVTFCHAFPGLFRVKQVGENDGVAPGPVQAAGCLVVCVVGGFPAVKSLKLLHLKELPERAG